MKLQELEPFAVGFRDADVSGIAPEYERSYRIACGLRSVAENAPLKITPADWFAGCDCKLPMAGICYRRALGICVPQDKREEHKISAPELSNEIDALYSDFDRIATANLTDEGNDALYRDQVGGLLLWGYGGGHANPDFEMLLRLGTDGIREKIALYRKIHNDRDGFYDSLEVALSTLDILGARFGALAETMLKTAKEEDKAPLARIAGAFRQIPQKSPRDFFEAVQFFWMTYSFVDNDSPGLFDYTFERYYQNDDPVDRYECLKKLWQLFYRVRAWNLCIGGSDEYGGDRSSDLTYDTLRVAREFGYHTPNITMRFHKNSPERAWREAVETLATGIGMPAMYNDDCVCPSLESIGISTSDAHLYCMNGCNQIDIFGRSHMGLEDGEINMAKALELTLSRGVCQKSGKKLAIDVGDPASFKTFDELFSAYLREVEYCADRATEASNKSQRVFAKEAPNPWHSCVIQGCIEKGADYKNGGPIYGNGQILTEGLADAVDGLYAVKHLVFDTKKYTMRELVSALDNDFVGFDGLLADCKKAKKFGNDEDEVDALYALVTDHLYRYLRTIRTYRGGVFTGGCSPFNRAAKNGIAVGALPNGKRRDDSNLADSIGAVPGCDANGPTALLNSVLKANQYLAGSGNVMQMKFDKAQFGTDTGKAAFTALAKTYFREGGQTLQVNVLSAEELRDAYDHPEKHKNLIVRVGGFSAYFVTLDRALQENIIRRSELSL